MPLIVITCPTTNKEVSTGMTMDKSSFDSTEITGNQFECSQCSQLHTWDKTDARLQATN